MFRVNDGYCMDGDWVYDENVSDWKLQQMERSPILSNKSRLNIGRRTHGKYDFDLELVHQNSLLLIWNRFERIPLFWNSVQPMAD